MLIPSGARIDLLGLFCLHPDNSFHPRQLDRLLDSDYRNIHRELAILEQANVLVAAHEGRRKLFALNPHLRLLRYLWALSITPLQFIRDVTDAVQSEKWAVCGLRLLAPTGIELWLPGPLSRPLPVSGPGDLPVQISIVTSDDLTRRNAAHPVYLDLLQWPHFWMSGGPEAFLRDLNPDVQSALPLPPPKREREFIRRPVFDPAED